MGCGARERRQGGPRAVRKMPRAPKLQAAVQTTGDQAGVSSSALHQRLGFVGVGEERRDKVGAAALHSAVLCCAPHL